MSYELYVVAWYLVGVAGMLLSREAIQLGINKKILKRRKPATYGTIAIGALMSLLGPLALILALTFWVATAFEYCPIWTWPVIRDVVAFLRRPIRAKP